MFLQVTPILVCAYTCLPSSGDSSSSVEDLLDVDLLSGGVSGVGFSVCAERQKSSH